MTDLPAIANLIIGVGSSAGVVAIIGAIFNRAVRKGDAADRLVTASGNFTDRVDKRNSYLETALERTTERMWKFADLLRRCLPYVEPANPALAARITAALESGAPQDPPADPTPAP